MAYLVDQHELQSLTDEKTQLFQRLTSHEKSFITLKQILNRLGEIIQRQIELNSPELPPLLTINQISTYLTDYCRRNNMAIYHHVSDLLPAKYKNPSKQNFLPEDSPSSWGTAHLEPRLTIQDIIDMPSNTILEQTTGLKSLLHVASKRIKILIEADATKNHYELEGMPDLREKIETGQFREPTQVKDMGEAFDRLGLAFINLGKWINENFAPPAAVAPHYTKSIVTWATIVENARNVKFSLLDSEWLDRDMYRMHQSKHGAAVKDKVETTLCKHCSKLDREKYVVTDFVEMEWDWNSETHWRCPECHGTDFVKRGLTREQCGDLAIQRCPNIRDPAFPNKPCGGTVALQCIECGWHAKWEQALSPIESRAIELCNDLPLVHEIIDFIRLLPRKFIATRKVKLGVDLRRKA